MSTTLYFPELPFSHLCAHYKTRLMKRNTVTLQGILIDETLCSHRSQTACSQTAWTAVYLSLLRNGLHAKD